ncbi:MAG: tetratricopeptide repeat protein [Planctomycetota bacterium]|jgi:serine/threonine protein kinase/Tfp pilus assembly protein PilF
MDESEIFAAALERDAGSRPAYLDAACGQDHRLRERVERLLDVHERAGSLLEHGPAQADESVDPTGPGESVGPYKLMEEIGEGGFGVVYVAEQAEPVRRRVALKVIKPGMDTREVVSRFEAERQALALMDHPNIARVFDGGATPSGRPYFVMELVKGVHIHDYCDRCQLPLRDRLHLFVRVCRAVQHAHQKGIIHRDIKPSNVLVAIQDGESVPKVIDFGVAKATEQPLTEATFHTRFAQMIGTPQYMSPEQAEMSALDVDTRGDIYSLGVLLYELLTGTTPLTRERLATIQFDELRRIIREENPPTPSARLTSLNGNSDEVAAARRTELRKLVRLVHGELDWIVMKALEKDRTRRYETASALAADVERYLAHEPVEARKPSAGYLLRKFVRRNRKAIATSLLVGTALLIAGANLRERAARDAQAAKDVEAALHEASRLREEAWARTDRPAQWRSALQAAFSALKPAQSLLATAEGSLDPVLATRVRGLASGLQADERDRRAVADLERVRVERPPKTESLDDAALRTRWMDQIRAAFGRHGFDAASGTPEELGARIAARREPVREALIAALDFWTLLADDAKHADAEWLHVVLNAADHDEWRTAIRAAVARKDVALLEEMAKRPEAAQQPDATLQSLARELFHLEARASSVDFLRLAQAYRPESFWINWDLAEHLRRMDSHDAIAYFRVAVALRPRSAGAHLQLGTLLDWHGHDAESLAVTRKAIEIDPNISWAHANLGNSLRKLGRLEEAVDACHRAIQLDPNEPTGHLHLGNALQQQGELDAAEVAFLEAIELDPKDAGAVSNLGILKRWQGDLKQAAALQRKAIAIDPHYTEAHSNLGVALWYLNDVDGATKAFEKTIECDPRSAPAHNNLGRLHFELGNLDKAEPLFRKAIALDPNHVNAHHNLGALLAARNKSAEAEASYRNAIEIRPRPITHDKLGVLLAARGETARAIAEYERALALEPEFADSLNNLAWLLATAADPSDRDPERAVNLAMRAVKLAPQASNLWNTLGVARYRADDLSGAVAALRNSMERGNGGNAFDWLFLAMAYARQDRKDVAQRLLDRAVAWTNQHAPDDEELRRFRAEAEELLDKK